ncbi:MAG: tetratricopeptide repeat protein [Lentisphaeria bacterium]|nr:tetratricopeptide repeat protein [Lentisphaeria bacterium]
MKTNAKTFENNRDLRQFLKNISGSFIVLLAFLLPVKFGSLAVMPEAAGFFPEDFFSWLIINWPSSSFGIFSGMALLSALVSFGVPDFSTKRGITALLWCFALPLAGAIGAINSTASFYAEGEICHLLSVSAFCGAVWLMLSNDPEGVWKKRLTAGLAFGVLLLCFSGLRQYFFGFAEMKEFIADQQAKGIAVSGVMLAKVADTRVYGAMVSANILAGFLMLTVPLSVVIFGRMGKHFEPEKISVRLFTGVMLIPAVAVFLMTKTRAAFLCALITVMIYFFTLKFSKKLKVLFAAAILCAVIGGAVYIKVAGRGFGSLSERADYMRTAAIMLPEKPLAGHGWGGFFYRHMKEKTTSTDESAHDPHNIFASFILHAGIPAGVLASAAFLFPLFVLFCRRKMFSLEDKAVFWGCVAFTLHCCCDINMQVPGCLAGAGMLFITAVPDEKIKLPPAHFAAKAAVFVLLALLGASSLYRNQRCLKGDVLFTRFFDLLHSPQGGIPDESAVLRAWQELEKQRKDHPFACNMLGDYFMAKQDIFRAEQLYKESLKRDPHRPGIYMRLADVALKKYEFDRAEELRKKAHTLFPTHPRYKRLDKQF